MKVHMLVRSQSGTLGDSGHRSADGATIVAIFVFLLFVLPAKLVVARLPLSISAATIVALGLGALWLFAHFTTTLGATKGRSPVRTALLVYGFVLLLSFWSMSAAFLPTDERAMGDHAMVTTFALICVGLAVCDGVTSRRRIYFLIHVIVGFASFVAVVGVLQYLLAFDLTPYLRPPGMRFTAEDVVIITRSGIPRVSGTTAHPIEFGVFCAMVLPLALHLTTLGAGVPRTLALRWAAVGLLVVGLVFSMSRSAIVALATVLAVLAIGWPTRRRVRVLTAALGFVVVLWVLVPSIPGTLIDLFLSVGNDGSVQWRTHDYATARNLISENPFLGRGIGTWYVPKHEIFDNQYLVSLIGTGVLGLFALLGVFGAAVYASVRTIVLCGRRYGGPFPTAVKDRDLAYSILASTMVVFPTFATFDFMEFSKVASVALLLVGLAGALLRVVGRECAQLTPGAEAGARPAGASRQDAPRPSAG